MPRRHAVRRPAFARSSAGNVQRRCAPTTRPIPATSPAPGAGRSSSAPTRVQGRQPHRLGRRADLLRGAVALPGADRAGLDRRPRRPVPADDERAHRHRPPGSGGNSALGDLQDTDQRHRPEQGRRRRAARPRPRRRAVVGVGLRRRLHARVERDLRGRGGPAVLEAAAAADRGHAGDGPAASRSCSSRSCSPARSPTRVGSNARARRRRGDGLEHRQVAGAAAVVLPMLALLYYAAPNAKLPRLPVGQPRAASSRSSSGSSPRPPSRSTSPTSAPTTRPTARSAA